MSALLLETGGTAAADAAKNASAAQDFKAG
jgi:hypothetical protein